MKKLLALFAAAVVMTACTKKEEAPADLPPADAPADAPMDAPMDSSSSEAGK